MTHRRPGRRFGRLLVTSTMNGAGAPRFDPCRSNDDDGNDYGGWAIRVGRARDDLPTRAVVVAWRGAQTPWPMAVRRRRLAWWVRRRFVYPLVARLCAPSVEGSCDLCGVPLTGAPYYYTDDVACVGCRPQTPDPEWQGTAWGLFHDGEGPEDPDS